MDFKRFPPIGWYTQPPALWLPDEPDSPGRVMTGGRQSVNCPAPPAFDQPVDDGMPIQEELTSPEIPAVLNTGGPPAPAFEVMADNVPRRQNTANSDLQVAVPTRGLVGSPTRTSGEGTQTSWPKWQRTRSLPERGIAEIADRRRKIQYWSAMRLQQRKSSTTGSVEVDEKRVSGASASRARDDTATPADGVGEDRPGWQRCSSKRLRPIFRCGGRSITIPASNDWQRYPAESLSARSNQRCAGEIH